jgi:hypothetical protein
MIGGHTSDGSVSSCKGSASANSSTAARGALLRCSCIVGADTCSWLSCQPPGGPGIAGMLPGEPPASLLDVSSASVECSRAEGEGPVVLLLCRVPSCAGVPVELLELAEDLADDAPPEERASGLSAVVDRVRVCPAAGMPEEGSPGFVVRSAPWTIDSGLPNVREEGMNGGAAVFDSLSVSFCADRVCLARDSADWARSTTSSMSVSVDVASMATTRACCAYCKLLHQLNRQGKASTRPGCNIELSTCRPAENLISTLENHGMAKRSNELPYSQRGRLQDEAQDCLTACDGTLAKQSSTFIFHFGWSAWFRASPRLLCSVCRSGCGVEYILIAWTSCMAGDASF